MEVVFCKNTIPGKTRIFPGVEKLEKPVHIIRANLTIKVTCPYNANEKSPIHAMYEAFCKWEILGSNQ